MASRNFRVGVDAVAQAAHPNRHYGGGDRLKVISGSSVAYLRFGLSQLRSDFNDALNDLTLQQVLLTLYPAAGWSGVDTLTVRRVQRWSASKVTWNTRPDAVTGSADGAPATSATLVNGRWTFDVTTDVLAWLSGETNYGWSVTTGNADRLFFAGFEAPREADRPRVTVAYSFAPAKPVNLRPSAAATSVPKPRLTWVSDSQPSTTDTTDDINAVQIQVDPASNTTTPAFDSGWVASDTSIFDLATTTYPGLASGGATSWRVRVRNTYGTSKWSEWAAFSYVPLPTLTITDPATTTSDPTPLVVWTFTGQTQRRIRVTDPSNGDELHDSGWQASTDHQYIPIGTPSRKKGVVWRQEDHPLEVSVYARDAVIREATPGARNYASASKTVTFVSSPTVPAVDYLTVFPYESLPVPLLRWDRSEAPDGGWAIRRDGELIEWIEDPIDARTDTTYSWVDWTAAPFREYRYEVRPRVNGAAGKNGPVEYWLNANRDAAGVWLVDPDTEAWVCVADARFSLAYGETTTVHTPVEAASAVKVNHGLRGLEGSVEGVIATDVGRSWEDQQADLFAMKAAGSKEYRLIFGDLNIPVQVFNVSPLLSEETLPDAWRQTVRFDVLQQGELPWRV